MATDPRIKELTHFRTLEQLQLMARQLQINPTLTKHELAKSIVNIQEKNDSILWAAISGRKHESCV